MKTKENQPIGNIDTNRKKGDVVIGIYYYHDGSYFYLTGGGPNGCHGHDHKGNSITATDDEIKKWTPLKVNDFPNSDNPRFPYIFDLNWDIKRVSDLKYWGEDDVFALIKETYNVDIQSKQDNSGISKLKKVLSRLNDIENGYIVEAPAKDKKVSFIPMDFE